MKKERSKKRFTLIAALLLSVVIITDCTNDESIDPIVDWVTFENYPSVDGSTSTAPLNTIIACKLLGIRYKWEKDSDDMWSVRPVFKSKKDSEKFAKLPIKSSQTHQSFINLIDKKTDIILTARTMSPDEKASADNAGVRLIETPIALDAFVFIVNPNNPITSLTIKQIQDIYTGEITNWNEVGGNDALIKPYVRNANSGSQELMESLVMKDLNMLDNLPESAEIIFSMGGAFERVVYDVDGICYTVYYYKENILKDIRTKGIAVNSIYPNKENITNNSYPLVAEVYAVIRDDLNELSTAYKLYELLQTEIGKKVIAESGYLPN